MVQLPHDSETNKTDFSGNYGAMDWEGRLGHRIGGSRSGPVVIVHGHSQYARKVFERLLALPSLPFLRGRLYLVYRDQMPEAAENAVWLRERIVEPDARFTLPPDTIANLHAAPDQAVQDSAYWRILAICARLGMINGRGVPLQRLS